MKIVFNIEAESVEDLKKELETALAGFGTPPTQTKPAEDEPKPRKSRTTAKEEAVPPVVAETPIAETPIAETPIAETPAPVVKADPLAATPAPADPLATSPVVNADPLAAAPAVKQSEVSLATIREKIGSMPEKRQQIKDLIASYKKADGAPCDRPGDVREEDYADLMDALDFI